MRSSHVQPWAEARKPVSGASELAGAGSGKVRVSDPVCQSSELHPPQLVREVMDVLLYLFRRAARRLAVSGCIVAELTLVDAGDAGETCQ